MISLKLRHYLRENAAARPRLAAVFLPGVLALAFGLAALAQEPAAAPSPAPTQAPATAPAEQPAAPAAAPDAAPANAAQRRLRDGC